jgi:cellulose synthase/poly-beta-1,6-N-acetylglucosamine synthase-like glycosyltransferase
LPVTLLIFAIIIILYGGFIIAALIGFIVLRKKLSKLNFTKQHNNYISIIASFKNEEDNVIDFIRQIEKQNYPTDLFELIIIDDKSTDSTAALLNDTLKKSTINYRIIQQQEHIGKKKNIALGIHESKGNIIITTDADVIDRHQNWLVRISEYFSAESCDMLIMPIDYINSKHILTQFQIIENLALTALNMGYTSINKAFMCNGANLAFTKKAYQLANGYQSHINVSSGEDVLLLEDIKKQKSRKILYGFNTELIVRTKPIIDLSDFISQRVRWAYKAKFNPNKFNLLFSLLIVAGNMLFLALALAIIKQSSTICYFSIFATCKLLFDFLLLLLASAFLKRNSKLVWLIPFECIYWAYSFLIGVLSIFWKPKWKGNKIN